MRKPDRPGPMALIKASVSWLLAWQMATPSASAASVPGRPGSASSRATIACTWSLAALPWPVTACLTCSAVYSATLSSASTSAQMAAPRAWPSSKVDCGLTLTKTFSMAAVGPVGGRHFGNAAQNDFQAHRQFAFAAFNGAGGDVAQLVALLVDDAKAGGAQAWVDAENNHRQIVCTKASGGKAPPLICDAA